MFAGAALRFTVIHVHSHLLTILKVKGARSSPPPLEFQGGRGTASIQEPPATIGAITASGHTNPCNTP